MSATDFSQQNEYIDTETASAVASGREIWKYVPRTKDYYMVSTFGRVKSMPRRVGMKISGVIGAKYPVKGKMLNPMIFQTTGRAHVKIRWDDDIVKRETVYRLVAETFIKNPMAKPFVNHKNGDYTDNNVKNLEWVTPKENAIHARVHLGKDTQGEDCGNSKLTWDDVYDIRSLLFLGASMGMIADAYGVLKTTVWCIKKWKTWRSPRFTGVNIASV